MNQDNLFEKEQECISYKDEMIKDLAPHYIVDTTDFIKEIFYSPIRNSCIYVRGTFDNQYENRIITDFLTKEEIEVQGWSHNCLDYWSWNQEEIWKCLQNSDKNKLIIENKIKQLKWE